MVEPIRVGIIGVGNCANSLLQGLHSEEYRRSTQPSIGLVRPKVGPYGVADIDVVAAFDVTRHKVGIDLSGAIWAHPNATFRFAEVPFQNVEVMRGPTFDGIGRYMKDWVEESPLSVCDVPKMLKAAGVHVLVNYLPVGSERATLFYAQAALDAGCAFINCIPCFVASDPGWALAFSEANLPIIGDDIKSQVGATIVHRVLAQLFRDRGVHLDRTMQLNVGGNGDFMNMMERERLVSKKLSKTEAVVSISGVDFEKKDVHIGPSDYVEWLGDRKWAYIRLEGRGFGGAPLNIELKLEVWDSPNSAGIVIDAIRCAKLAMDRREGGPIIPASAYFMKRPLEQFDDDVALTMLEKWLEDHSKD